jgi:hypothetical protein
MKRERKKGQVLGSPLLSDRDKDLGVVFDTLPSVDSGDDVSRESQSQIESPKSLKSYPIVSRVVNIRKVISDTQHQEYIVFSANAMFAIQGVRGQHHTQSGPTVEYILEHNMVILASGVHEVELCYYRGVFREY